MTEFERGSKTEGFFGVAGKECGQHKEQVTEAPQAAAVQRKVLLLERES